MKVMRSEGPSILIPTSAPGLTPKTVLTSPDRSAGSNENPALINALSTISTVTDDAVPTISCSGGGSDDMGSTDAPSVAAGDGTPIVVAVGVAVATTITSRVTHPASNNARR